MSLAVLMVTKRYSCSNIRLAQSNIKASKTTAITPWSSNIAVEAGLPSMMPRQAKQP